VRLDLLNLLWTAVLTAATLNGQQSVCDLFKVLNSANGRQLTLNGDMIISRDFAALGAGDCDNRYALITSCSRRYRGCGLPPGSRRADKAPSG
jgi:hypothetical protein